MLNEDDINTIILISNGWLTLRYTQLPILHICTMKCYIFGANSKGFNKLRKREINKW